MDECIPKLQLHQHFQNDGKIDTIDQLSFVTPDHRVTPSNQTSLNVLHVLVIPSPSSS